MTTTNYNQGYYYLTEADKTIKGCNRHTDNCKKDSCPAITIQDSNYEYNPIHGSLNDTKSIICNNGYSFNHGLFHQGGKIQCNYEPNKYREGTKRNKMSWYISNPTLDKLCKGKKREDCKWLKNDNQHVRCVWEEDDKVKGTGKCLFRHKIDINDRYEPICKPLLCPQKYIPYSNKSITPLPGPTDNSKGECINIDTNEPIIGIDSSADCMCYSHSSCDKCTRDDACQWCSDSNIDTEGSCFSKRSNNPLCNENIKARNDKPKCINLKNRKEKIISSNTKSEDCEKKKCFKKDGNEVSLKDLKKIREGKIDIIKKYQTDEDFCIGYNNIWGITPHIDVNEDHKKSTCTYKNNYLEKLNWTTQFREFGVLNNKINIESHYCAPINKGTTSTCYKKSINKCLTDKKDQCKLVENLFNNRDIKWTNTTNYSDIIHIGNRSGTTNKCYYNPDKKILSGDKNGNIELLSNKPSQFKVTKVNKNTIDITSTDGKIVTIDESALKGCGIQYTNTSNYSKNNIYNADNNLFINTVKNTDKHKECIYGNLVCNVTSDTKSCGVSYANPTDNTCHYKSPKCSNKPTKCKTGTIKEDVDGISAVYDSYTFTNSYEESSCNETGYKYKAINNPSPSIKNIGFCNAPLTGSIMDEMDEMKCNTLNKRYVNVNGSKVDTVHWGSYCAYDEDTPIISFKTNCEKDGGEWLYDDKCYINGEIKNIECPTEKSINNFPLQTYGKRCLVELPVGSDYGIQDDICEKWNITNNEYISDVIFEYNTKINKDIVKKKKPIEKCNIGELRYPTPSSIPTNKNECEKENIKWGKLYEYIGHNTCPNSLKSDKNLNWTGGNIQNNTGGWGSTCSSSIMSSCKVNCDSGYDGGGMYYCNYNNDSIDVCKRVQDDMNKGTYNSKEKREMCENHINCTFSTPASCSHVRPTVKCNRLETQIKNKQGLSEQEKKTICEKHGECLYDNEKSTCSSNIIKGRPEWIGPRCYTPNNILFDRGTGTIKTLYSEVTKRPFQILFIYSLIAIAILILVYQIGLIQTIIGYIINRNTKSP